MIGTTITHYRILEELEHGGMGEVFLAEDTKLHRKVALKFILPKKQQDPETRNRFIKEAGAAAAIDHPFICKVYEISEFEGKIFIAMEYIEGQTLHRRLALGPIPLKDALRIGTEIAEALEEIHRKGIVHRDLNPSNIMLTRHDHVKVMDFGLALPYLSAEEVDQDATTLTPYTGIAGTLAYIAPEQLCAETLDNRTDIFSFGIVLYEMITGVHPFREKGRETAGLILYANPPPLARYTSGIPEILEHTLRKMLAKDLNKRYQSVHEVLSNLNNLMEREDLNVEIGPDHPTIAVLPFVDMSPEKNQVYLCEGLAEELINALVKLENLSVAARTSAFRFRESNVDIREIGRQLNVKTILEGSVRKSGDELRIGVELINVEDGYELWAQRFDRKLDDVFAIQDEISRAVVDKLSVSLFPTPPTSGQVYALYLKGRFCWNQRTEEGLLKSIEHFKKAIDQDKDYALAYASLSASYITLSIYGVKAPSKIMPEALSSAEKALALNPRLAMPYATLGCVRSMYNWDWKASHDAFRTAVDLDAKNEVVHQWYATNYLIPLGIFEEARSELQIARKIDPLNLAISTSCGLQYYFERQYDRSIEEYTKTLEMDPNFAPAHLFLGQAYLEKGMFREAIASLEQAASLNESSPETKASLGHAYARAGKEAKACELIEQLTKFSAKRYISPVLIAQIHIGFGDIEEAFNQLEKAFQMRSTDLAWIRIRPYFDSLKSDHRFSDLCQKIGFPK